MKLSSIRTLSAAFALFCLAAFSAASAKADTITTFQATGAFNGAGTLSGTLTIDITTGTLIDSAIQVANDSFSGFTAASNSSGTTLTSAGGFPTMHLLLPVDTLKGYAGGTLGSFANRVSGLGDYSNIYFSDTIAVYLKSGSLTPASAVPEPATFATIGIGLLLIGLGLRRQSRTIRQISF